MKITAWKALILAAVTAATLPLCAQDEPVLDKSKLGKIDADETLGRLRAARTTSLVTNNQGVTPSLPLWQYSVVSPIDNHTYTGAVVGGNPFNRGARTTTAQVVLIPLRIALTGTPRTFDPTSPDTDCLPSTPWTLAQQSPMFNTVPNLTMNGVNVGTVNYLDGFQRAEFWSSVSAVAPAYHLAFNVTVKPVQTITTANDPNGSGASFNFGGCGTNSTSSDNPPRFAFMDINFIDTQLNTIITNLGLTANQFPFFVTYRTYMTDGPPGSGPNGPTAPCCVLGYHSTTQNNVPANAPGQTYGIAAFDNGQLFGSGTNDVSVLSHELLEWINDPSGVNLTPEWGNIGQVGGCVSDGMGGHTPGQHNFETGDPLSGNLFPGIAMPNGFTYHPQENAFYSWFFGGTSLGAGGKYSNNGTFTGFAKTCASGGGTN